MRKICPGCGTQYEATEIRLLMRDQDSFECVVCDTEVMKWNGASMFSFKRIMDDQDGKN